jgi:uncharacterized protein (DUF302 family)
MESYGYTQNPLWRTEIFEHGTIKKRKQKKDFLYFFRLKCGNETIKTRKRNHLSVPLRVLAWRLKDGMKHVP